MSTIATITKSDELIAKMSALAPTVETPSAFYDGVAGLANEFDVTITLGTEESKTVLHVLPSGSAKLFIDGADPQEFALEDVLGSMNVDPNSDDTLDDSIAAITTIVAGAWNMCKDETNDHSIAIGVLEPVLV